MADSYVNGLTNVVSLPILDTDYCLISRDGINVGALTYGDLKSYVRSFYRTTTSVSTSSNTVFTNLTDLQFPVEAGATYFFEYIVRYQTAATTTGIVFTITAPTGTISASVEALVAADGTAAAYHGAITSSGDIVTTTTVAAATTDTILFVKGVMRADVTGTVIPQFRSSAAGSAVSVSVTGTSHGIVMKG